MDLTLNNISYKLNEKYHIEVFLNGELTGTIYDLPYKEIDATQEIFKKYATIYDCLFNKEVTYKDLTKLYEMYTNCEMKPIGNTLIVLYNTEIIAVLVDVMDLDYINMDMRAKLVFYYFARNEFKPYYIDYKELLIYSNDVF